MTWSRKTWWIVGAVCALVFAGALCGQMAFDAWRLSTGPSSWYLLNRPYPHRRQVQLPRLVSGPYRDQATCEREKADATFFCEQMLDVDARAMRR